MIQKPKGTYDVYKEKGQQFIYLETLMKTLMEKYNYQYVRTPIFEATELFHRGVGETTDIVSKETYDFKDRGDRSMTLRPEGTAGVVRSYIENKLYGEASQPIKTWYYGPMFRYERPQAGRFREFYQFGVEVFGASDPMMDVEVISIPVNFYKLLGLKGIKVKINSLGDQESRESYRKALLEYFKPYVNDLCEDCQARYEKNPLRILDCKVDHDSNILTNAPKMCDYLNETSKRHFEKVKEYLNSLCIPYEVDPNLVRGLDYYTHTVFEVEADIKEFGSQNVLCGGGRYDHLVENIGGPETPGVGFAMGMERLLAALDSEEITLPYEKGIDAYIIPMSEEEKGYCFYTAQVLRMNGFKVDMDNMNRALKGNFKQADRLQAKFVILVGEKEVDEEYFTIKNNVTKEEFQVDSEYLVNFLDEKLQDFEIEDAECSCNHDHDCHCEGHCNCKDE